MPFRGGTDKQTTVHLYEGILLNHKKGCLILATTWMSLKGTTPSEGGKPQKVTAFSKRTTHRGTDQQLPETAGTGRATADGMRGPGGRCKCSVSRFSQ